MLVLTEEGVRWDIEDGYKPSYIKVVTINVSVIVVEYENRTDLYFLTRNRLKYALTAKEVQTILKQRLVKIDGHIRTDPK